MLRNLSMVKVSPQRPIRSWRKSTGPGLVTQTATVIAQQGRGEHQQAQQGGCPVEGSLGEAADAGQLGPVHVQQRQPSDRADVDPRPDHVGDGRGHEELRGGVLEFPAELPEGGTVELLAGQDGDGVHLEPGDDLCDLVHPTQDRQPVERVGSGECCLAGRQQPMTRYPW
jgi:hypothetical protein